jgi:L-rhamnose mutarotase
MKNFPCEPAPPVRPRSLDEVPKRVRQIASPLHVTPQAVSLMLTRQLFGCAEVESEEQWAAIASTEVCQKWWKHMGDVMPSNPDHSPVSAPLREVFHLQ